MKVKTVIFFLVTCTVIHRAQPGIILDRVGNSLNKINCRVHSIGNSIFHPGQQYNPCEKKQNGSPQDGYVNQGSNGFQIWLPFKNRGQENWGQRNPDFNGENTDFEGRNPHDGYMAIYGQNGSQNQYNRDRLANNGYYGNTQKPLTDNYGNTNYQFPRNRISDNRNGSVEPSTNIQRYPSGQSVGNNRNTNNSINGSNTENIPAGVNGNTTEIEYPKNTSSFTHNGGPQSQNCTNTGVSNNNLTAPTNCTHDGRRFLTTVRSNCAAGQVADSNGICRDEY